MMRHLWYGFLILGYINLSYAKKKASTHWFDMSKLARALLSSYSVNDFCHISNILKEIFYGDSSLTQDDLKYPFPLIARYQNPRIIHQKGAFTIHGTCQTAFEDLEISQNYLRKIIIPFKHRKDILDTLHILFFNEYSVLPDYKGMKKMFDDFGSLYYIK